MLHQNEDMDDITGKALFGVPCPKIFNSLQKLPHNPRAILRRISPQHRTEHLDGFFALPVIHPGADVADVRAEMVDDLLNVLQLLRSEVNHAQTGVYSIYLEPIIAFFRDYQHLTENRRYSLSGCRFHRKMRAQCPSLQ